VDKEPPPGPEVKRSI